MLHVLVVVHGNQLSITCLKVYVCRTESPLAAPNAMSAETNTAGSDNAVSLPAAPEAAMIISGALEPKEMNVAAAKAVGVLSFAQSFSKAGP